MRSKKEIAKDQMEMAPYRKGGRTRRYAEGGDVENYEDAPAPKVERIGKSALEEGEEEFQRVLAQRGRRASRPATRAAAPARRAASPQLPTRTAASGVPVGEDELAAKSDERPQARQPSTPERMLEALPAGAAGIGAGAALGRTLSRAMNARRIADAARVAKDADLARKYETARSAQRGEMGTAAEFLKNLRQGEARARSSREDQYKAFIGERYPDGYSSGGSVSSASSRADGIAQKGKTKGRVI